MQSQKKIKSIKNKLTYLACLSVLVFSFVFYLYSVSGSVFLAKAAGGITYGSKETNANIYGDDDSRNGFLYKEIVVSDGSSSFTLMDRNLGAKAAWDGVTIVDDPSNYDTDNDYYGYYYQWGNIWGFSSKTIRGDSGKVNTTSTPSNYSSTKWSVRNSWNSSNGDLWGDVTDSQPARRGPCPVGWHVPTHDEWVSIYDTWNNSENKSTGDSVTMNFAKDLRLPFAGYRNQTNLQFGRRGEYGYYWSSSRSNSNQSAHDFIFSLSTFNLDHSDYRSLGAPVRCLKNSSLIQTYTVAFDSKGGNQIASQDVREGELVTKPQNPTKVGTNFISWNTIDGKEFDFKFPIIQNITLYAKWEGEGDETLKDEDNYLLTADGVVVTGVANTIEYLTSLYLYVTDPYASTSVELKYDENLNALLINSPINANAMGIGFNNFGEGIVGSVSIGGSGNVFRIRSQEVYNDYGDYTGTRNGKNDSAVGIGGENNRPSAAGGVIVGGKNNTVSFTDSTMVGGIDSSVGGHNSVFLGSRNSSLNVQDWNSIDMGTHNRGDKFTYLIGSGIDTHPRGTSWAFAVNGVFAWSPDEKGFPLFGGGLGGQQGFYINAKNGFGLNTSTPRLTFDFRSGGPLKVTKTDGIQNNSLIFSKRDSNPITCWDRGQTVFFRGTMAYVQSGGIGSFCGCNGSYWMPLSANAVEQSLCAEANINARVCDGAENLHHVVFHTGTKGASRWDENANDGKGAWVNLNWTYMGVPSLLSGDIRECSYTCAVGYHPNNKSAKGWFTGDCEPCDDLTGGQYVTPGTGVNDCEFRCNGGYKYDKWAEKKDDRCTPCKAGEWTPNLNQFSKCNICKLPNGVSAQSETLRAGIIFTGGVLWNGTTGTGEPYFRKFTTFASTEDGCKFECASGFYLGSGGTTCVECGIGTFSKGGKDTTCFPCENRVQNPIKFSFVDSFGNIYRDTIAADKASWYTTKGKNGPNSCQWMCNPEIGLVKDGNSCKCPNGSHLELIDSKPICVSNYGDLECEGDLPALAIKGPSVMTGVQVGNLNGNDWTPIKASWKNVNYTTNLKVCEWTCPKDYKYDKVTNTCKLPPLGECGSQHGNVVNTLNETESALCKAGTLDGPHKLEFNYFFDNKFQFYPVEMKTNSIKYLATWTCKGFNSDPKYSASCYAYIKGPATRAQCPSETQWRDASGKAKSMCIYGAICTENLNCPPIMDEAKTPRITVQELNINDDSHGKKWSCPGAFGGNKNECHSCDEDYSWWNYKEGCTLTEVTTYCSGSYPSDSNLNIGKGFYTNVFSNAINSNKGGYNPGILYWTHGTDEEEPGLCKYACVAGYNLCGSTCFQKPKCARYATVDGSGNVSGNCGVGRAGTVYTGDNDTDYRWICSNGCLDSDECGDVLYSCGGSTQAHTVLANGTQTRGLRTPDDYELYASESAAAGKPCALVCAAGFKYKDGRCVQFNCPDFPLPDPNAKKVDNGKYSELDVEPTGNVLYATVAEAQANPCGYVCDTNYVYSGGICVCKEGVECVPAPKCGKPHGSTWNRRKSPQWCAEAFGEGTAAYNNCLAGENIYKYCEVGTWTGFTKVRVRDRVDHVEWECENGGVLTGCQSKGCRGGTDNVNPNALCVNQSNSDSILINRPAYNIGVKGGMYNAPWSNEWLQVWFTDPGSGIRGQGTVEYKSRKKPTSGVHYDKVTFTTTDENYCETWDLTLVQCPQGQYCDDNAREWRCCEQTTTRTDEYGKKHEDCVLDSMTYKGSINDYGDLQIERTKP